MFGLYNLLKPALIVLNTELAREVLVKNFKNFHKNGFEKMLNEQSDPLLSFNPFFRSGDQWKDKRNEITPAFSQSRIKAMFPYITSVCQSMTKYLKQKSKIGETLEARDVSQRKKNQSNFIIVQFFFVILVKFSLHYRCSIQLCFFI